MAAVMKSTMKLHPFEECVQTATPLMEAGHKIHQQFNCEHCGIKQTMDLPNKFYYIGTCEECGKNTDIRKNGCNYLAIL
jgi:hypothetical protein